MDWREHKASSRAHMSENAPSSHLGASSSSSSDVVFDTLDTSGTATSSVDVLASMASAIWAAFLHADALTSVSISR